MRMASRLAAPVVLLLVSVLGLQAQSGNGKRLHTLHTIRVTEKVTVDGNLNDGAWAKVPVEWDFTQRDPIEGKEPSERTELRIIYDDTSIYFGVRLFDHEPQKIVRQFSRRDDYADADRFALQLSPGCGVGYRGRIISRNGLQDLCFIRLSRVQTPTDFRTGVVVVYEQHPNSTSCVSEESRNSDSNFVGPKIQALRR
jgi:hypothetical protein